MKSPIALITAGLQKLMNAGSDQEFDEFVNSSAIYRLTYDEDTEELGVFFQNGGIYTYYSVPQTKAKYMIDKASSKGKYLNNRIKNIHTYTREI